MPTLFKRDGSPYWWLCSTVGGKTQRVSTGVRHDNRRTPCPLAVDILRKAEERQAAARFGLKRTEDIPLKQMVDDYCAFLATHSKHTQAQARSVGYTFFEWASTQGLRVCSEIDGAKAAKWIDERRLVDQPSTLKTKTKVMARMLDEMKRRGHIQFEENPFRVTVRVPKTEKKALTLPELRSLLDSKFMVPWVNLVIHVSAYTGARLSSVVGLRWEDINFAGKTIRFRVSKTGSYVVPIHPELERYLLERAKFSGPVLPEEVLSSSDGYVSKTVANEMRKLMVNASAHTLRHTYVTFLERAGINKRDAMRLVGHTCEAVHDIYSHREAGELQSQLIKLDYTQPAECAVSVQ